MSAADYPSVQPRTTAEWRRWLRDHHASARGAWLISKRLRGGAERLVEYEAAVEEALCYGWIDGQYKPVDETHAKFLFTPRRPGSGWSRSNRDRVTRLIREGRMQAPGLAKIEAAKRDGSWSLLESVEAMRVPPDLKKALGASGMKRFAALTNGAKRAHLYALVTAKRPETRAKRIADIARAVRG